MMGQDFPPFVVLEAVEALDSPGKKGKQTKKMVHQITNRIIVWINRVKREKPQQVSGNAPGGN